MNMYSIVFILYITSAETSPDGSGYPAVKPRNEVERQNEEYERTAGNSS